MSEQQADRAVYDRPADTGVFDFTEQDAAIARDLAAQIPVTLRACWVCHGTRRVADMGPLTVVSGRVERPVVGERECLACRNRRE